MMQRVDNWPSELINYLAASARLPFEMGKHDCALFAADAIKAMTGEDPAAVWRGRYTTMLGGLRVLRKEGYQDHVDLVTKRLTEKPVALACPGDLAVVPTADGPALGIVQGESIYVLRLEGLALVPLTAATRMFEV